MDYNALSVFGNLVLVGITAKYAYDTHWMIKLSRNAQEVVYIQTRLEKLYYPLKIILNKHQHQFDEKTQSASKLWVSKFRDDLFSITPYLYLSSDALCPLLNRFIDIFDKNGVIAAKEVDDKLGELIQDEDLNEKETEMFNAMIALSKALPVSARKEPSKSEIKEASDLYTEILTRVDIDIQCYRNRLNELTNS